MKSDNEGSYLNVATLLKTWACLIHNHQDCITWRHSKFKITEYCPLPLYLTKPGEVIGKAPGNQHNKPACLHALWRLKSSPTNSLYRLFLLVLVISPYGLGE